MMRPGSLTRILFRHLYKSRQNKAHKFVDKSTTYLLNMYMYTRLRSQYLNCNMSLYGLMVYILFVIIKTNVSSEFTIASTPSMYFSNEFTTPIYSFFNINLLDADKRSTQRITAHDKFATTQNFNFPKYV